MWMTFPALAASSSSRADATPASELCQRGLMPDSVEEFLVNRDFQVKNCLFTKQLFFPLRCARPRTGVSGAAILRDDTWNPEMESCLQEVMRVRWKDSEKELHSVWESPNALLFAVALIATLN